MISSTCLFSLRNDRKLKVTVGVNSSNFCGSNSSNTLFSGYLVDKQPFMRVLTSQRCFENSSIEGWYALSTGKYQVLYVAGASIFTVYTPKRSLEQQVAIHAVREHAEEAC